MLEQQLEKLNGNIEALIGLMSKGALAAPTTANDRAEAAFKADEAETAGPEGELIPAGKGAHPKASIQSVTSAAIKYAQANGNPEFAKKLFSINPEAQKISELTNDQLVELAALLSGEG